MTDAIQATGESSLVENFSNDTAEMTQNVVQSTDAIEAAEPVAEVPNGFLALGLAPELIQAVKDLGFTQPTTVQLKTIPIAMQGHGAADGAARFTDLMVSSQTGSGKTAAFLLPVLHTLLTQMAQAEAKEKADFEQAVAEATAKGEAPPKRAKRKDPTNPRHFAPAAPGALIVCPTRELAQQVAHDAIDLVQHCRGLRVANIVGGMPYQLQIAKLQNANLVVATPGRLLDLQRSMQIKLDQVQFLVVDEADRMLDLGFSDDLADINQLTIQRKQTMMFSATFAPRIQQLASRVMRDPQKLQIDSPQEKHANISQKLFWADNAQHKRKLLDHWLRDTTINQAIVFASTQIECDGLANDLQQEGFSAVALHGALSQGLRNRRLMALRQGQVQILVATDVAARGIDVPTVTHVFNFGLPMKAEDYTHRIGRTGRAGRDGIAVTFAEFRDRRKIMDIEFHSHHQFKGETIPGMEPQQRFPDSRPNSFGGGGGRGGNDNHSRGDSRGGNFGGGGGRSGGFGASRGGFNDRNSGAPRDAGAGGYQNNNGGGFGGQPEGRSYERKGGFNDRFAGARNDSPAPRGDFGAPRGDFGAPRGDFGARKPAFGKPSFAKPGNGGKVFVPRDAKKWPAKTDR
ncbi:MAG: DEAD/DEAH box helicase [Rhodoferax sp.]|uniref:DEAD/DEAH box helicase n=1 Tax=Rhodoferax sp. TaxID=50421 RepID=UPI00271E57E5|nr:DEAD/DEAH box helicase [Rhodoferax sp.]MDO8449394.1 DEAD/DEAH box helicase [Rhodoferax sp.]